MVMASMSPPGILKTALALGFLLSSAIAPSLVMAQTNYTQVDMMRAQLALMGDRSGDCPPW